MTSTLRTLGLFAALLAACGTQSYSSGNGPPPPAAARVSQGVITAKATGTLTVNGAVISVPATATVRIDRQARGEAELRRGMLVRVKGDLRDRSGTASQVEVESHVRGRVHSVSTTATSTSLDVGGRIVHIEDSTHLFDDAGVDLSPGDLQPDDRISVTGFSDDQGRMRAGSIQRSARASADDSLSLKGYVSGLSTVGATTTFTLSPSLPAGAGALTVTVPAAGVAAGVQDGSYVEVHGPAGTSGTTLAATTVALEDDKLGPEATEVEVEGMVTSGTAAAFQIGNQKVSTSAATRWEFGTADDFAVGARLEAEGHLDASNLLVAEKVSYRASARIQAAVSGVTATSLTTLGIAVSMSELTRIEDPPADGQTFEIRGLVRRDASGAVVGITATRIRSRSGGGSAPFLQGPVDQITGTSSLSLLGVTVTTASAQFRNHRQSDTAAEVPMTRDAFFAALVQGTSVVKARLDAAPVAGTASANELELEDEPGNHP